MKQNGTVNIEKFKLSGKTQSFFAKLEVSSIAMYQWQQIGFVLYKAKLKSMLQLN